MYRSSYTALMPESLPPSRRQRLAAYAVITRDGMVLLSRLAPRVSPEERWTLPGGGVEFGEHPADAVQREVLEETGLRCEVGRPFWTDSARRRLDTDYSGESAPVDLHSVRVVYDAWVPADAPEPRVNEVDGSTVDARWHRIQDVDLEDLPTVPMVRAALAQHRPPPRQRLSAYALITHDGAVLLVRNSVRGPAPGSWTLPGGGVEHGERPVDAVGREVQEECGVRASVGDLLGVHDEHFVGTAPHGRQEDFHGVHLVYAATVANGPIATEAPGGTTDAAAWVTVAEIWSEALVSAPLVRAALAFAASAGRAPTS